MSQHMHRTQIYLTDAQCNFLSKKAELKDTSMASVIRELINKMLPKDKDFKNNPLFRPDEDKLKMKTPKGSVDHDEYIYFSK